MSVELYSRTSCVFCKMTKKWFQDNGIAFIEHNVDAVEAFNRMQDRLAGAKTVPQIVINGHAIGSYDALIQYEHQILDKLRRLSGAGSPDPASPGAATG